MTTNTQAKNIQIAAILAGAVGVYFLWPQLSVIILTVLLAYIFYPLYIKLKRPNSRGVIAAIATLLISFMIVIIPLAIIISASIAQLFYFIDSVTKSEVLISLPSSTNDILASAIELTNRITGLQGVISDTTIINFLKNTTLAVAQTFFNVTVNIISGVPQLAIGMIIYAFLFVELLLKGPKTVKLAKRITPFDNKTTERYFNRIGLMANAMVKGQLIIAMTLALIEVLLLIPLGYGSYSVLLFIVFTILNFIPLGAGVILIPLAVHGMLTGQIWVGALVIIAYFLAGNLDPVLRARLIPKSIKQSVAVTMIATICGIACFGMLGVVYGPILMLIISTTLQIYSESKQEV